MSEIRANTISDAAGTGPAALTKQSAAKAWATVDMAVPELDNSFNVSSLTDSGTGRPTLNFTNSFVDAFYSWAGTGRSNSTIGSSSARLINKDTAAASTASLFAGTLKAAAGSPLDEEATCLHHGDLA